MTGASEALSPVHKLTAQDITGQFDCGREELDRLLKKVALANQAANATQTYVTCRARCVVGYYSLAVGSVQAEKSPPRAVKGLARHPIPVMILARLAADVSEQETGIGRALLGRALLGRALLGRALLKDAVLRTVQAADIAGIRALVVHAKDKNARRWYEQFDFEPSPIDPLHLFLLLKDLKKLLK